MPALGASFSKEGQETCCFLLLKSLLYPYLTQNISGSAEAIFVWIWQKINQAEPSVEGIQAIVLNKMVVLAEILQILAQS